MCQIIWRKWVDNYKIAKLSTLNPNIMHASPVKMAKQLNGIKIQVFQEVLSYDNVFFLSTTQGPLGLLKLPCHF